jgi:hypothetical protein
MSSTAIAVREAEDFIISDSIKKKKNNANFTLDIPSNNKFCRIITDS